VYRQLERPDLSDLSDQQHLWFLSVLWDPLDPAVLGQSKLGLSDLAVL
jgi:hypothetical protein